MEKNKLISKIINGETIYYDKAKDVIYDKPADGSIMRNTEYQRVLTDNIYDTIYEVTTRCNQLCRNCFAESNPASNDEMEYSFIFQDIQRKEKERIRIAITGGEPFLHSDIDKILSLPTVFQGLSYVINTNGYYVIKEEMLQKLINYDWLITFSIHGRKEVHNRYTCSDSYDYIINNISRLQGKVYMHIYSVLNRFMTVEDIDHIVGLKNRYGIDFVRFIIPRKFGRVDIIYDNNVVDYIYALRDKDVGIKVEKSLSELINVNKVSRLAR